MRVALSLLLLLALAAIPGSLLPQTSVNPADVATFRARNPDMSPWLDRLSMFSLFTSPWFAAIYLLLMVSLTGCVLPRAARLWRIARDAPVRPPRDLSRMAAARHSDSSADPPQLLGAAARELRRRRYRVEEGDGYVSADKGRLHEAANLLFHLSLLLVLVGVAVGHLYGFRGRVVVVEGSSFSDTVTQYDEFLPGPSVDQAALEPFSLTLRKFTATYQRTGPQRGAPRTFTADITYREDPMAPTRRQTVTVNEPLNVHGTKVFLTGHGYAPRFTIRDGSGTAVFSGPVVFLPRDGNLTSAGAIKAPDAAPTQLGFQGFFLPTAAVGARGPFSAYPEARVPRIILTAYTGDLGLDSGVPQSVYRLDTSRLHQVRVDGKPLARALAPGQTMRLPNNQGSITFDGVSEFANFQIAHDPGKGLALLAAGLMLAGLLTSLTLRPRKLWVRAGDAGHGRARFSVAAPGAARRSDPIPDQGALFDHLAGLVHNDTTPEPIPLREG